MTEATAPSLLARTATGAGWIIGWRMMTRLLGLVSTLILVRVLLPADFGLVTLATSFGQALDSVSSLGVEEAVIREKDPGRDLYDSAFTINALRGLASALVLAGCAWPIATFFGDARLLPVVLALSAGVLVTAFESIGIVDFRRDMAFEKEFLLMIVPRLVSIAVAISLAFVWRSHWALVAAILTANVTRTAMTYAMHPYRPRLGLQAWRQIAGFSFWSWAISVTTLLRDRCDSFVIGRMLGLGPLGLFSVGAEIAALPTTELVYPLGRACFSGFSASRLDGDSGTGFLRVIGSAALVALPAGFGVSLIAHPLVILAFGDRWAGAVGLIEILGVAFTATIPGIIGMVLLQAHAVLQPMFRAQLASVILKLGLLVALVPSFGMSGAGIGVAIAIGFENTLYVAMAMRRLRLRIGDLWRHLWRSVAATAIMSAAVAGLGDGWTQSATLSPAASLALGIGIGASSYAAGLTALWLACGRPEGAERDMVNVLARVARGAREVMRRQTGRR